jgi:Na+/H+ antiporter NhaD/arsenite permease-like protein
VLLFAGQPPAKVAVIIGALLLLTRRVRSQRVYAEIDWSLLLMFAGLIIIIAGAEHALLLDGDLTARVERLHLEHVPVLSALTALSRTWPGTCQQFYCSNLSSPRLPDQRTAWLTVAMASTLAGNFTIIGSIANLIVVQGAAGEEVNIGFRDYFKVGADLDDWDLVALAVIARPGTHARTPSKGLFNPIARCAELPSG